MQTAIKLANTLCRFWKCKSPRHILHNDCKKDSLAQNAYDLHGNRFLNHGWDMDIGKRSTAFLPHFDNLDRHWLVPESIREQSLAGVARWRFLLDGHRGFQGYVLSKILPDHADHFRSGFLLGPTIRRDTMWFQRSTGSFMGGRDGRWFLALQRHEVAADNHTATTTESRLGEDRTDLQVHQASHHQPITAAWTGNLDVQAKRERRGFRLCYAKKPRSAQVPSSGSQKFLHVGRRRPRYHSGRVSAKPRQRRVPGESQCCLVSL